MLMQMDLFEDDYEDEFGHDEMSLDEYQGMATEYAFYNMTLMYPILGLNGEAGEVAEKLKKLIRDNDLDFTQDDITEQMEYRDKVALASELGDVLWYLANTANDLGYSLEEIALMNLDKLEDRSHRNRLRGSGDFR